METMHLIIFIISCTVFGVTVNGCPSSCYCSGTNVDCSWIDLTTIPSNVPNSTTVLELGDNYITRIDAKSFQGMSALTKLNLEYNDITRINNYSLNGLSALTELSFFGNRITRIDTSSLNGLSALTELDLSDNDITRIDANSFQGMSALRKLELQHNEITRIDANIFKGMSALTKLILWDNRITRIDTSSLNGLSALTELWLGSNEITRIDANSFQGMSALTKLDLSYNKITRIPDKTFNGLSALTYLWLHSNQIVIIDVNIFNGLTSLKELSLSDNLITTLEVNLFKGVSSLEELHLSNNKIVTLDVHLFQGLSALKTLWLQNNQIAILDVNVFNALTALENLYLKGNPFDCSMCIMKRFQDFLQKNNNFGDSGASCDGDANRLIHHNFTSCKGTQKTTESYLLSVTTEYSARTTESTTGIINTDVIFLSSGGGILFLLGAAIACFCALKKYKRGNLTQNVNNHDDNVDRRAESSPNVSTNRGSDAQYEEIEEIEMSDVIVSPLEQRNLTDGDISSDSSADGIQVDEERRRNNTNVYQSLQRSSLNESRLYSSLKSLHLEEIVDEPI